MPAISGSLRDITDQTIPGQTPQIVFTLSQPQANTAGRLYPTEPVVVTPAADGTWRVTLADTTRMTGDAYYSVQIRWQGKGAAATLQDFPDWRIVVTQFDAIFTDCIVRPVDVQNRRVVWVGLEDPPDPIPNLLQLDQDINDPLNPANSGRLYMWVQEGE